MVNVTIVLSAIQFAGTLRKTFTEVKNSYVNKCHALLMKCSERKFCYSIVFSGLHVNKIKSPGYKIFAWFHHFLYSKKEAPREKRFSSAETTMDVNNPIESLSLPLFT